MLDTPKIGDRVAINYLNRDWGSMPETAVGTLNVCLDENMKAEQIVVETDGGAAFIWPDDVIQIEVLS